MESVAPTEATAKDREVALRSELKQWEKNFSALNEGKHPTREDIKQDAAIASRYKLYNTLRQQLKQDPGSHHTPKKRKRETAKGSDDTRGIRTTPEAKQQAPPRDEQEAVDEGKENITPSADRTFVGPTPQKDGRVLGLFDLLSPHAPTPSKAPKVNERKALEASDANAVPATPSKGVQPLTVQRGGLIEATPVTVRKHSRTPQSLGKRYLLDSFLTPSKRRRIDVGGTPSSSCKHTESSTPAFLNRAKGGLVSIAEDGEGEGDGQGGAGIRRRPQAESRGNGKRRGLTRSLSSMIADLRKAEDDRLDDDMDMLREMDEAPQTRESLTKRKVDDVLVEDSQALGPDGMDSANEAEEEVQLGRDGKPLRVWKKKGLKRQTRKVHMKPRARRKSPERQKPEGETEEEEEGGSEAEAKDAGQGHVVAVAETQIAITANDVFSDENAADDPDLYEGASDAEDVVPMADPAKRRKTAEVKPHKPVQTLVDTTKPPGKDAFVQKTMKKISASANANFRKLKIKSSKGAKAAQRGKFGRGRR